MFQAPVVSLAWADRLYAPLRGRSCAWPAEQAKRALEEYRAVSRLYPNDLRPHLGAARCLFRIGQYQASVSEYLIAKAAPDDLAGAMAWADRLYAPLTSEASGYVNDQAHTALEAYRAVARRFPREKRAHRGAARCLFRLGRYRAAVSEYSAGEGVPTERATAEVFATVAYAVQGGFEWNRRLLHLVRMDREVWIAVTARPERNDEYRPLLYDIEVRRLRLNTGRIEWIGQSMAIPDENRCEVEVFAPASMRPDFVVRTQSLPGSSAVPNDVFVVRADEGGLRRSSRILGLQPSRVWARRGKFCVSIDPGYKVWFPDTYEWAGNRFRFANASHPEEYATWLERPTGGDFHRWMDYAVALTIHRRKGEAIAAWREAERCCRRAIRDQAGGIPSDKSPYYASWHYGDFDENLRQIRMRIGWLLRGEMGHALLYRPVDFDLQTPPYRLGNPRSQ